MDILFDNNFVKDFSHLGDIHTKEDLDEIKSFQDRCWDHVRISYLEKGKYEKLIADDPWFNFDPKRIIPHSTSKLRDMWSSLRRYYINCKAKNTKSGQHGGFKEYCGGNVDVLYFHHWLNNKPNMLSNVEGFFEHEKFDSIPAAHMDADNTRILE